MSHQQVVERTSRGVLAQFEAALRAESGPQAIADGMIGKDALVPGPFGDNRLVYADYIASGRPSRQVESFILETVLPYYANSHTEASYCGQFMTRLRNEARARIAALCGAGPEHAVVFCGSGATAGLNRLVHLLGVDAAVAAGRRPLVCIGPYEHHSNILPWRESGAEVVEIREAASGGPDPDHLEAVLATRADAPVKVGAMSAASNVTGIVTDVAGITRILKAHGALAVWDYAAGAPYLPVAMTPDPDAAIDAIVMSPHKFVGGPGASGLMIVRRDAVVAATPTWPGGGTVDFVTAAGHDFSGRIEAREEGGTPNVVGDIRAALALIVKDVAGQAHIAERNRALAARAFRAWAAHERIEILGDRFRDRLPFFSFRVRDGAGGYVHHQLVTRLLSDRCGIQARGGCACAGPYGLRLMDVDEERALALRERVLSGREIDKPGFVRLNLSHLMADADVDTVLDGVADVAAAAADLAKLYEVDIRRATSTPVKSAISALSPM